MSRLDALLRPTFVRHLLVVVLLGLTMYANAGSPCFACVSFMHRGTALTCSLPTLLSPRICYHSGGSLVVIGGTSVGAPAFAGIGTMLIGRYAHAHSTDAHPAAT